MKIITASIVIIFFILARVAYPAAECHVETWSLNAINPVFDGNWQGITAASDGNAYFGASTHAPDSGVAFFRFNPQTRTLSLLAEDLTVVAGYDPAETVPQGKIHSPIVELDGWLYFTTHLANYWPEAREAYPGAHLMGYHIETGAFRDFGVIRPRFSIYSAIAVDPLSRTLTVFTVPFTDDDVANDGCHIYRIDIDSGAVTHLGQVVERGRQASFWMFVDSSGNTWFSIWRDNGNLFQICAQTDEIIRHQNVLPDAMMADGSPVDERSAARRSWTWVDPLPGRDKALFTMGLSGGNDERLWIFDPSRPLKYGEAFRPIGTIGATFLSVARGGNRVYFVQYRNLEDARRRMPEGVRDRNPSQLDFPAELHLRSIAIQPDDPPPVVDHGRIVDQHGRVPRMMESLAANPAGQVFMVGSWSVKHPDEAAMQYVWEGQRFWPNAKPGQFKRMDRGEFFGYVKITTSP